MERCSDLISISVSHGSPWFQEIWETSLPASPPKNWVVQTPLGCPGMLAVCPLQPNQVLKHPHVTCAELDEAKQNRLLAGDRGPGGGMGGGGSSL